MKKSMKFHALAAACALLSTQSVLADISQNATVIIRANNDSAINGDTTSTEGVYIYSDANNKAMADFQTNGKANIYSSADTTVWINNGDANGNPASFVVNDRNGDASGYVASINSNAAATALKSYDSSGTQVTSMSMSANTGVVNIQSDDTAGGGSSFFRLDNGSSAISAAVNTTVSSGNRTLLHANTNAASGVDASIAMYGASDTTYVGQTFIKGTNGVSINATNAGNVTIGNGSSVNTINGSNNTMTTATGTNTLLAVANKIEANGQFGTNAMTAGASNTISAGTTNTITGGTGNVITATTGNNSITATAGANTISAGTTNTISAMGTNGANTMQAEVANNLTAGANNITATGANVINAGVSSSLTAGAGANGLMGFSTFSAGRTVGTSTAANYVLRAGDAASKAIVTGALGTTGTVNNIIQGDTLVDGNMYINGSLTYSSNTSAETVVSSGTSIIDADKHTSAQLLIANEGGTGVDANGKITSNSAGSQATAALTLTNGLGNVHGMVVTENQASLSGGQHSSTITMDDNGATFSNAETGAPVQVHGVADGTADFDAINVRQFAGAIAAVTAQANIPSLAAGQDKTIGVGLGHFMGKTGLAVGMNLRGKKNGIYKLSVSTGLNGGAKFVVGGGAAWSF